LPFVVAITPAPDRAAEGCDVEVTEPGPRQSRHG
jgi:hypothetical protein